MYFMPDPVKALVRLGQHDIYCQTHVDELYTSFADNNKNHLNDTIRSELTIAILDHYQKVNSNKDIFEALINSMASLPSQKFPQDPTEFHFFSIPLHNFLEN